MMIKIHGNHLTTGVEGGLCSCVFHRALAIFYVLVTILWQRFHIHSRALSISIICIWYTEGHGKSLCISLCRSGRGKWYLIIGRPVIFLAVSLPLLPFVFLLCLLRATRETNKIYYLCMSWIELSQDEGQDSVT